MRDIKQIVADNLRAHRAIARLSQQEVAERIGRSAAAIKSWENGETAMGIDTLNALADLYGVSADALLGRTKKA